MLSRLSRTLFAGTRMWYATAEKKNVVKVPKTHQVHLNEFSHLENEVERSPSCKVLAALIKVL